MRWRGYGNKGTRQRHWIPDQVGNDRKREKRSTSPCPSLQRRGKNKDAGSPIESGMTDKRKEKPLDPRVRKDDSRGKDKDTGFPIKDVGNDR